MMILNVARLLSCFLGKNHYSTNLLKKTTLSCNFVKTPYMTTVINKYLVYPFEHKMRTPVWEPLR